MSLCVFTPEAREDLRQIHDYIAQSDPGNAHSFLDRIESNAIFSRNSRVWE